MLETIIVVTTMLTTHVIIGVACYRRGVDDTERRLSSLAAKSDILRKYMGGGIDY